MKTDNRLIKYIFFITMTCILFAGSSCNTQRQAREIIGNYDRHPVFEKSLPWQDPKLTKLERISHAFVMSKDTFVITLIDKNDNKSFINPEDVVVISTMKDSVAPIIPSNSSNVALFSPVLDFDYFGTKFRLSNVSSDGRKVTIYKIKPNQLFEIKALITDQISFELEVLALNSDNSNSLLELIQAQNKKYILLDFWLPSCTQCFENIPMLKQFDKDGIGIVNLFHIDDDEVEHVKKDISRFSIPGINLRSSPKIIKYFSQNGFPFYVLINTSENKICLSSHRIGEIEMYLNN